MQRLRSQLDWQLACLGLALFSLFAALPARAIPSFARRYQTSCQTCHTIFPKLTPFGEAFRRNGYKFPGRDQDFVKEETVPLGQDAYKQVFPNAVWPGVLPVSVPLALGFNGQAVIHPDTKSSAAKADNGSAFTTNDLVAEAHLWAGDSFDSNGKINYFGEITFSSAGSIDIEHARIHFNDLFGPRHLFNLWVGRGFSTLSSFGPHSSYLADNLITPLSVTGLYGASESWNVMGHYNGAELNGMAAGRFIYSIGVNAGTNHDIRPTENVYAHVGFKIGGMRLDGEGDYKADPQKPWAETALTLDAFGYRSASHTTYAVTDDKGMALASPVPQDDQTWTAGGGLRFTIGSLELNSGIYGERHNSAQLPIAMATLDPTQSNITAGGAVTAIAQYNELSYIVFPWMVPAIRVEYLRISPSGGVVVSDLRIIPGIAFLIRPNLKATLIGQIERADGAPDAGWGAANGSAAPMAGMKVTELESITAGMAFAF